MRTTWTMRTVGLAVGIAAALVGCRRGSTPAGTESCTPGSTIVAGCNSACGVGACSGDPVLRVCDGTYSVAQCESAGFGDPNLLGENDDGGSCGGSGSNLCPLTTVVCPSSGSVTVIHRAFSSGRSYECLWDVQAR